MGEVAASKSAFETATIVGRAARYTPSRSNPKVGKSIKIWCVESLPIAKPCQPAVGSAEFDTANKK
jgi:hypothetical protein